MLPLIVVYGPTASGKSALAIDLARQHNGEIISADARQIYRGLNIGTGKISPQEMGNIPHWWLDLVDVGTEYTVAEFQSFVTEKIREISNRGKTPILCGGTGLYIDSIVFAHDMPAVAPDWDFRQPLYDLAAREGNQVVWELLNARDPHYAQELHPNNIPYVIRALEVLEKTGQSKTLARRQRILNYDIVWYTPFDGQRERLYSIISTRVEGMFSQWLIAETERYLLQGFDLDTAWLDGIGYRESIDFLRGKIDLDTCKSLTKQHTRNYAKRQITWCRRYSEFAEVSL